MDSNALPVVKLIDPSVKAWKTFLESAPANTPQVISNLVTIDGGYRVLPTIRLKLHCPKDGGLRGFDIESELHLTNIWEPVFVRYRCRDCGTYLKEFAVVIKRGTPTASDAEVMKLGEYPPFAAPISPRITRLLTRDDLELFRQGTRSEAQGLGIGAATYFRRIVENQWRLLVKETRKAAERLGELDLSVYDVAVRETQFSNAVEMLKGKLPAKLLILDGQNPLMLLYRPLSVGLHGLTDIECLQQAADIRTVLTALLENIAEVLKEQGELKQAADRLSQVAQAKPGDTDVV
jgi:hypothetical protein